VKHFYLFVAILFLFTACANKEMKIPNQNNSKINNTNTNTNIYTPSSIFTQNKNEELEDEDFRIAIIFPSKVVGKYGNSTINSVIGYLLFQNKKFEIESFDSEDESFENISNAMDEIKNKGYKKIIALFTSDALSKIRNISAFTDMQVYFPLISRNDAYFITSPNYIYGAISYENQMKKLLELSTGDNAQFYEDSSIGNMLKGIYERLVPNIVVNQKVMQSNNNFKSMVTNESLKHTNLMINTTLVKSSIILSQLYAYETENGVIMTTQLNFDPLILSLTQYEDRLNLILASSIEDTDPKLTELLYLLDTDIKYNWVNYSTLVGVNYLFSKNKNALIKNQILNQEVLYNTHLYYSTKSSFKKLELK
jgi:SRSO17 transposase|tara:strand:+ start:14549 stop:15646 length:1098 start_codon:yes stop_codon:yes gene_type:complete